MGIHKTAIVDEDAILGKDIKIGPYSIIEKVKIDAQTEIGPFCHIKERTEIGKNCEIFEGVSIGNPPQDISYKGKKTKVVIGDNNIIREFVTIHRSTEGDKTLIGNNNYLMAYVHIAHDCKIGNNVIIANATQLSGFVEIEDFAFVSGLCPIHQFVRIGGYCMIAGGYRVPKDVVPYSLVSGDPLRVCGVNKIGIKRQGFPGEVIGILEKAFKFLFFSDLNTSQAITKVKETLPQIKEIKHLTEFIENSKRGIVK